MAGADLVSDMLRGAGFDRISLERFDAEICIGRTLDDAIEFAMALGPRARSSDLPATLEKSAVGKWLRCCAKPLPITFKPMD